MKQLTLKLYNGREGENTFRTPQSIQEMINHCSKHGHIWFHSIQGDARRAKVNGKVRTWKTQKDRIEIPVKYGMYEYGILTANDIDRVLIPVK